MTTSSLALARAQVSHQLSRRLPYYLAPQEAHQLIDAPTIIKNERDRLFIRLLWETGVRVSEAIRLRLQDVQILEFGGRLDALQEQLGHRDINTIRIT